MPFPLHQQEELSDRTWEFFRWWMDSLECSCQMILDKSNKIRYIFWQWRRGDLEPLMPHILGENQGFRRELNLPSCDNGTSCSSHVSLLHLGFLSFIYHSSNILSPHKLLLVFLISIQLVRIESDLFLTNFPSSVQQEPVKYCAINKNVERSKGLILWFKKGLILQRAS